jgi:regulator of sigma E protease
LISILINAIKIIFLLGFLIWIHETGHFIVAKICKVKVNEFAIGFGPTIWKKQGKETKYALRLIPLGGFVSMEGEEQESNEEGSFSKASIPKKIAIIAAGALVNIIFALIIYFILCTISINYTNNILEKISLAGNATKEFVLAIGEGLKQLVTGSNPMEQLTGPVGISQIVSQTNGIKEFIYILAVVSMSLGVTNLIPFPPLDGGKILLLIIEAIRKKSLKQETEIKIQMIGFSILITLSIFITYNDILRIIK